MKVEEKWHSGKIWGIELLAENPQDIAILARFWSGGLKLNSFTSPTRLQLTFADLIEEAK